MQHVARKHGGGLGERHDLEMIGLTMAGGVCCRVGQHHIGRPIEQCLETIRGYRVKKIELEKFDAGDRRHVDAIDGDDASPTRRKLILWPRRKLLPSPLWGGVGGGGRGRRHFRATSARPPTPTLPHKGGGNRGGSTAA